jgi:2-polyprenyl-3-methyl-5-hydroxy-6-metoxy-1,4-benzoquinol methylase
MSRELDQHARDDLSQAYAHGYDSDLTRKLHAARSADKQASWFLPFLRLGMTVLDCGCGSGAITVGLATVVAPGLVTGIDISDMEIERARTRAAKAAIPNIQFEVGDLYQLRFPDGAFDAVFAHNVLEHLRDPAQGLHEMQRVLKPGGVIGLRDIDFGGHLLATEDPAVLRYHAVFEADLRGTGGHPRLGRQLRALLHNAGFRDIKASASYEAYSNQEATTWWSRIAAGRTADSDFAQRVVNARLATETELQQMRQAYLAWGASPGGFFAMAHGEAVAWKA